MAKAKLDTDLNQSLVSTGAAPGPVTEITSAADGVQPDKGLPASEGGAEGGATAINDAAFDREMKRFVSRGKTVLVKGPENGRWRAGRHFTMEPTSIPLADLSDAELEKLCGDPLLTVAVVDAPY